MKRTKFESPKEGNSSIQVMIGGIFLHQKANENTQIEGERAS